MFWTFQNIRIGLRTNTKVAANEYEVIRINTVLCDAQRMPIRIGSQTTFATVGRGHKEGNPRLAKRPLKTNGRLANLELTSLAKEAKTPKRAPNHLSPPFTTLMKLKFLVQPVETIL